MKKDLVEGKWEHVKNSERNVTGHASKQAEGALLQSEAELTAIYENAPIMMILVDEERRVRKMNRATIEFTDRQYDEIIGLRAGEVLRCIHSLDDPAGCGFGVDCKNCIVRNTVLETFRTGKPNHRVAALIQVDRGDGVIDFYVLLSTSLLDVTGEKLVLVCMEDITELKRAEEALKSSLSIFRDMGAASVDEVIEFALEESIRLSGSTIGYFHFVNPDQETIRLHTWSNETLKHCSVEEKDTHYPISKAGVWVDCIHERRAVIHNDYRSLPHKKGLPEGHVPVIREMAVPIFENDKIVAVLGVGNKPQDYDEFDIQQLSLLAENAWMTVQRRQAEDELRRSEERYVLAQRAANIGSWDWNILTGDLEWSERIEPMFGFAKGEFGATYDAFLECVHPDDRRYVEGSVNAAVEKDADYNIEHRIVWPDGTVRWVSEDGDVFRDEGGNPIRMLGIVQDITERKQAEEHIGYLNHLLLSIKDIGQIISHESNLKKLLREACNLLLETRNYIDVTYSILDDEKRSLVLIEHSGEHQREMLEITLDEEGEAPECVRTVLKTGSRMIIISTVEHCAGCQYCTHGGDHQTILIPMLYEKSFVGIMTVCLKAQHKFDEMEINLLEEIAEDLAFAHAKIKSDEALRKARDELEKRVHERTTELVKANEALQAEIAERLHYQSQLRSLASELSLAEERERRRIATELHDRIVQTLAVSKIKLSALREAGFSIEFSEPLQNILGLINQAIQDTRSLTFELSPPILYELGFVPAVEWLAEKYKKQYNILTKVEDNRLPIPLDADVRIVLFQTVRELLNNVVKHARAKKVEICIKRIKSNIQVQVEDDGVGFDTSEIHLRMENASGFGLFNIRERLDHLGGHFEIKSNKGQGTRVILHAPLKQNGEDTG